MEAFNTWITPALLLGIILFLWKIRSDINVLRQSSEKLEGLIEGHVQAGARKLDLN